MQRQQESLGSWGVAWRTVGEVVSLIMVHTLPMELQITTGVEAGASTLTPFGDIRLSAGAILRTARGICHFVFSTLQIGMEEQGV